MITLEFYTLGMSEGNRGKVHARIGGEDCCAVRSSERFRQNHSYRKQATRWEFRDHHCEKCDNVILKLISGLEDII